MNVRSHVNFYHLQNFSNAFAHNAPRKTAFISRLLVGLVLGVCIPKASTDLYANPVSSNPSNDSSQDVRLSIMNESELQAVSLQKLHAELEMLNRAGNYQATVELLHKIIARQQNAANKSVAKEALLYSGLAMAYLAQGRTESAGHYVEIALSKAEAANDNKLRASIFNDQGKISATIGNIPAAMESFRHAADLAKSEKLDELYAIAQVNLARALFDANGKPKFADYMARAEIAINALPATSLKADLLLAVGKLYARGTKEHGLPAKVRLDALRSYQSALDIAQELNDARIKSFAYGYLGELYEDEARYQEALGYSELALFAAQSVNAPESRYLWEWQTARLHADMQNIDAAIVSYRQAIETINQIRKDLVLLSDKGYSELIGNLYTDFADVMLRKTEEMAEGEQKQRALAEVHNAMENMRVAELEDYLQNQCADLEGQQQTVAATPRKNLIVYPLVLNDRVEVLSIASGKYYQTTSVVDKQQFVATIKQMREGIEVYSSDHRYLKPAQQLYGWLIKPIEPLLAQQEIQTFVFIPDGALRTIPVGALHDGKQFLIQKYAMATTPGMRLTFAGASSRKNMQIMANGLTEAVQGFAALPGVDQELANIGHQYQTTVFKDSSFKLATVANEINSNKYSVVHFATHGEFSSDHSQSFLLTHDAKLTLDRLDQTLGQRRNNNDPLDLLVLSACQTASGDDRAALGLAGVAVQAGARSAVATLWYINDEATSGLVSDFYQQLHNEKLSKAQALQQAQINMIQTERFNHPNYWAPFLMIGNWM